MRIVAGAYGGRRLRTPTGAATRPTGERVREALFSILGPVERLRVLDLFAGSGALGLEALSRGAAHATFVDRAPPAIAAIRANVAALGIAADRVAVHRQHAAAFVRAARAARHQYDLLFLDPPYGVAPDVGARLAPAVAALVAANGRIVCESDRRAPLHLELPLTDDRRYGDTLIQIYDPE